ncbi:HNH endonuclease [Afipia carboxidovorans]|uniref:HNH endonuclease n=1 Tax=Afipia carboxidovorans TaxID=40137 RepID=UPI003BAF30AA
MGARSPPASETRSGCRIMGNSPSLLMSLGYWVHRKVRDRIAADHGWECAYCGVPVVTITYSSDSDNLATIDHRIPLSRGGTWKRRNLTCACRRCNNEKGDMTEDEFRDLRNTSQTA